MKCNECLKGDDIMQTTKTVEEKELSIKEIMIEYFKIIIGAVLLAVLITSIIAPARVIGNSMTKTLANNDYLFVYKLAYKNHAPEYKDIIVLKTNIEENKKLIKRVIGVPGDTIDITNDELYVNGKKIDEPYINEKMVGNQDMKIKVPEGKIFVMGDNRNNSLDSRNILVGLIDYKKDVIGKILFRAFPFKAIPKF